MQVDADEEDPEGQAGSPGSDGLLCVNYLKNKNFQEIGPDPTITWYFKSVFIGN